MHRNIAHSLLSSVLVSIMLLSSPALSAGERQTVTAAYIPLDDHYAAIVAYEKYRDQMQLAEFRIERMKSWPLLRAFFLSGEADLAFVMSPLAMDMFRESPSFRWIGLMHRDGNALAINDLINEYVNLPQDRQSRKPDGKVAEAYSAVKQKSGKPSQVGVPSLFSTHTVVLYKYLRDHGKSLGIGRGTQVDAVAIAVPPPKAPAFIKKQNSRGIAASFEQSLPWADVVETQGFHHVAWYSKDVLEWPNGHLECITLAADSAIRDKREAIREVNEYIHQAGRDIEAARRAGGDAMVAIAEMVRRHIPEHNQEAIIQSLRMDLNVINYSHLNVEKPGLKYIMDLALEGGILTSPVDIDAFADESFAVDASG